MSALFPKAEYQSRLARAQSQMQSHDLDALLLTSEVDFTYFTGFQTRFWQSPTRPWYLLLPAQSAPIAIIPSIGEVLMRETWVEDIRVWSAPDLKDDGIGLMAEIIAEKRFKHIGLPSEMESYLRMPLSDFARLKSISKAEFLTDQNIARNLRLIKSEAEIERIAHAAKIGGQAFARVKEIAHIGLSMEALFRKFQILCLEEGADFVPYLAGGAGALGYKDVIAPAGAQKLQKGDVFMLDTGLQSVGYFCDYNRNFSLGHADARVQDAHKRLLEATNAAIEAARPGVAVSEIFNVMQPILSKGEAAQSSGRLGHGLGLNLTEWPSIIADEHMLLEENMVMTIEPSIMVERDFMLVHEENIVIQNGAALELSPRYCNLEVI